MTLPISTKCANTLSKVNSIISKYSTTYAGSAADMGCISTTIAITAGITTLKNNAENIENSSLSGTQVLIMGGTADSLDKQLATKEAFNKWTLSLSCISSGNYIDPINTTLDYVINNTVNNTVLLTKLNDANSMTTSASSSQGSLINKMNSYTNTVTNYLAQIAPIGIATSSTQTENNLTTLLPALNTYNSNMYLGVNAIKSARTTLGPTATRQEVRAKSIDNIIVNGNMKTTISNATTAMGFYTTQLG